MTDPLLAADLARGRRLAWATLIAMGAVIAMMAWAAGGSAAFRTALIEDVLGLVPAIVFLVSVRLERRAPTRLFPFGFHRVNSLAFLIAAVALTAVGATLAVEAAKTLVAGERPSIAPMTVLGRDIWGGWVMIAALALSAIPPVILGRLKQPVARRLHDKVLHTDALMQRADWLTAVAGIAGVTGIAFGLWWADAGAALVIAVSVVRDGLATLRIAAAELIDGVPRALDSDRPAEDALAIEAWLQARFPGSRVMLRETGRYVRAAVIGSDPPPGFRVDAAAIPGLREPWRLDAVAFAPSERGGVLSPPEPSRSRPPGSG